MIKLIWAMDQDNLIGKDNLLPWHYKEDLIFFKNMTKDKEVVMGYNTYESMLSYYKTKPFPFSIINIATRKNIEISNANIINDYKSFIKNFPNDKELMVIGGKEIYNLSMDYADVLYVTVINKSHDGDTYFNADFSNFNLVETKISGVLEFRTYKKGEL